MTRLLELSATSKIGPAHKERSFPGAGAKSAPPVAYLRRVSNKMAILGMAVGYLGLVTILASAPIWNQVLSPYQTPFPSCTDFGGHR